MIDPMAWNAARRQESPYCIAQDTTFDHDMSGSFIAHTLSLDTDDRWGLHDTSSNQERITIPRPGALYLYSATVIFPANSAGERGVRIANSSSTTLTEILVPATSSGNTSLCCTGFTRVSGSYIQLQSYQNSGGTLSNLQATLQFMQVA